MQFSSSTKGQQDDYYHLELPWIQSQGLLQVSAAEPEIQRSRLIRAHNKKKKHTNFLGILFRTVASSSLIFLIGFFSLNWQAYNQIATVWFQKMTGKELQAQILTPQEKSQPVLLKISKDPSLEKKDIPMIALEVTPPDSRIMIPRINKNVPIVPVAPDKLYKNDWNGLEQDIQMALREGVIHYPGTAWPGEEGNVFITGHSSYYPWDPGRFKDVFALLHEVKIGDDIVVYHIQKKFIYKIDSIKTVRPKDVDVLSQPKGQNRLTLMTCTPIGTNINRLIVSGHLLP